MDDDLFDLPDGWIFCKFDEILDIKGGNQPPKSEFSDRLLPGYIRLLQIRDFESDRFAVYIKSNAKYPTCTVNDILIGRYGASVGKICTGKSGAYNVALTKVLFDDNHLIKGWVREFLRSDIFQDYLSLLSRSAQNGFNKNELSSIIVPLPPLNEQKRIVEKIESLRARSQAARKSIESIPTLIKQFRQSVLAAAFNGDLTKEWREQNSDMESAEVLLERIKNRRLNQSQTISKQQKLDDIYSYAEESLDLLPDGWIYATLDKISDSFKYGTSVKSMNSGEIPVLRMGNLQQGKIDWDDLVYTSDREEIEKYLLEPNTVLFNRTNSPELVGKSSIYRGERTAIFAGYLIAIEKADELNSEYLNFCLNTSRARAYCWKVKSDGVSQSNINAQKLAKFELPLCSIEEQEEIVNRIECLFSHIDRIEAHYKEIVQEIDRLDRSILHQAFTGRLVAQDPDDEPAKILLERIQIDRDRTKNKVKS